MTFGWSPKILRFDILISKHQWRSQSLTHPVHCRYHKMSIVNLITIALPTTFAFDRPVFANVISMSLNILSTLKSPYFEVRGCDVEGKLSHCNQSCFNEVLIRLVSWIKITLLLKIQWKQHQILYKKIVLKHNMMH